jgi:protein-disulfide isomerase
MMRHQTLGQSDHPGHVADAQFVTSGQRGRDGQSGGISQATRRCCGELHGGAVGHRGPDGLRVGQVQTKKIAGIHRLSHIHILKYVDMNRKGVGAVLANTRVLLTIFVIAVATIGTMVFLSVRDSGSAPDIELDGSPAGQTVRDNSHRLNAVPDSDVYFVEFLDFECEGCRAVYPAIEQLRGEYGDRVNFVLRYFPLRSHFNAERAARAVEAAAQQGQLEAMYRKMYETQAEWGEQQVPADDVFRGFAQQLGLDMSAFDATYHDPATLDRIRLDIADGTALGVQGTPTFFVNGERIQPKSYDDLAAALDRALQRR